jgi:hypothetical protein
MRLYIIITLTILLTSCFDKSKNQDTENSKTKIEWFVPKENISIVTDTILIIDNSKYELFCNYASIPNNTSDIVSEFGDTIFIEKTRNYKSDLVIKRNSSTLLKKTFYKDDFKKFIETDSLYFYSMTGFKFNGIKDNKFSFISGICLNNSDAFTSIKIDIDKKGNMTMTEDKSIDFEE